VSESERALAAYRLGRQAFMGLDLLAAPGALVPREETELLGRTAVEALRGCEAAEPRVIDVCCGSGNLACAVAAAFPAARVWASDLTDGCVALARRNAEHLHFQDRLTVVQGDLFAPLALTVPPLEGTVDLVVCNPPYISTGRLEKDRAELLEHEPREAFDGGPYGLSIHQRVIKDALAFLRPGGTLLFEIGAGQERQITILFDRARAYEGVTLVSDAGGSPRVALGRRKA
jgi:release factor glutamine methyltransferase